MSHKLWFCLYKDDTQTWMTQGIPYDLGKPEDDKLRLGPFRTKRACDYVSARGFMIGTVDEIELAAKQAENTPTTSGVVEKLLTTGEVIDLPVSLLTPKEVPPMSAPFCDETMPKEVSYSFLAKMVHSMMD